MELNREQSKAVECLDNNLQIIACAGSGKTEVITRRICNILAKKNDVKPENIVAFTFTNKAAENMRERIDKNIKETGENIDISDMYIGTIHSFCKNVLDKYTEDFKDFKILDTAKEHMFMMKNFKKSGAQCLDLSKMETNLYSTCIDKMISMYEREEEWSDNCREAFDKYHNLLIENQFLNFSFLIFEVLNRCNDKQIIEYFSNIKYLIVDEYQDVDDLQELLIHTIAKRGANICVVGDDDQTIYQFRGSNANNMIDFSKRYEDVVTINLNVNYRSDKAIIDVADNIIRNNSNRLTKTMKARSDALSGSVDGCCEEGTNEYDRLAEDILSCNSLGVNYSKMAILLRKRSRIEELTDKLKVHGIPYRAEDNISFFEGDYYARFRNIFTYFKDSSDENIKNIEEDWKHIVDTKEVKAGIRKLKRAGENKDYFLNTFHEFLQALGYENPADIVDGIDIFERILSDFDQIYKTDSWTVRTNDFCEFLEYMAEDEYLRMETENNDIEDAVEIMTVHKSKGLEFDAVFIPDLQEGFFPANKIGGKKYYKVLGGVFEEEKERYESTLEDERKLFYVALTRAKHYLYVYADVEKRDASRFINEMNESDYCEIIIPEKKAKTGKKSNCYKVSDGNGGNRKMELKDIYDMRAIRKATLDELSGAAFSGVCRGAYLEFEDARRADDKELLEIAQGAGIRIEDYRK